MAWKLAKPLAQLRNEVNAKHPNRRKDSDGTVGDTSHSARPSDHNPDAGGVVRAMDITHDPQGGFDSYAFAEWLRQKQDPRIKYVISNGRIFSATQSPWQWRKYTGSNPHDHHVHISVNAHGEDADNWGYSTAEMPKHNEPKPKAVPKTIRYGSTGDEVKELQRIFKLEVDGVFGKRTRQNVFDFQTANNLHPDGIVGPQTWKRLLGDKA